MTVPRTQGGSRRVWRELVRFLPDVARLVAALARDRRVPWHAKVAAGAVAAYIASPVDVIPDFVPVVGHLDDAWLAMTALRWLLSSAGEEVVRELWPGSEEGLAVLLGLLDATG